MTYEDIAGHTAHGFGVLLAMCRLPICSCMCFVMESYLHYSGSNIQYLIGNWIRQPLLVNQGGFGLFGDHLVHMHIHAYTKFNPQIHV
jgi:hypothetical protein